MEPARLEPMRPPSSRNQCSPLPSRAPPLEAGNSLRKMGAKAFMKATLLPLSFSVHGHASLSVVFPRMSIMRLSESLFSTTAGNSGCTKGGASPGGSSSPPSCSATFSPRRGAAVGCGVACSCTPSPSLLPEPGSAVGGSIAAARRGCDTGDLSPFGDRPVRAGGLRTATSEAAGASCGCDRPGIAARNTNHATRTAPASFTRRAVFWSMRLLRSKCKVINATRSCRRQ
mmetsp:Transcript_4761/g.15082  ORF Transcript_4761/g.15082 Transcript_4761/m.15082 type:complete len:229 (-) Transcript_4761:18-704(-)